MSSVVGHLVFAALSVPVACAVARHRARFHGATDDRAASGDHTQPSSASVGVEEPGRGQAGAVSSKSAVHRPITEPNHVSNDAASGVSADKARTTTEECASQNAGANTDAEPARPLAHGPSVLHQVQASSVPAGHDAQPRTPPSTSTDCMPGGDRVSPLRDHVSPLRDRVSPVRGYSVSRASSPVSDGSRDEALANLLGEVNGSASSYSYASGSQVHVIAHTASLVFTRQQGSQGSEGDDGSSDSSRAHAQQFAAAVAAAQVERGHDNSGQRRAGDSGDGTGTGMNATPAFASPGAAVGRVDSGSVDSPASATDSPTGQASPSWSRGPPHVHQGTGVGSPHHSPSRSTPGLPFSAKVSSPLVPERRRIGAQLDRRDAERSASPTQSLTGRPTVNIPIPSMGSMRSCPATTSSGPKSAGRRLNMSLSGEDTAGSPSVYLGSPRAALHTPSGTSVGSSVSRFSPFRRHAEAGGSPMSGRAKQLWKSFRHRATSLISATKAMSKRPPLSRKWSKGQLQRRGSWRRFVLHPPMGNMMSARLLQPHKVVPTDPLIARGTLPNGLQYYVAPNAVPREHVIMRLVLRVGALQEEDHECGLARFVEQMSIRGTESFSHDELSAFVHRASALGENSFDSSTTVQDTWFQLAISAHSDHYKHLEDGLRFLSEIPVSLRCSDADIHEERALYLSDWRSLQGASKVMADTYWHTLFKGSRYAERMPMGKLHVLQEASPASVRGFYQRWYRPDLMAIVVAGDMPSRTTMVQLVEKYFGAIPAPTTPLPKSFAMGSAGEAMAAASGRGAEARATSPTRLHARGAGGGVGAGAGAGAGAGTGAGADAGAGTGGRGGNLEAVMEAIDAVSVNSVDEEAASAASTVDDAQKRGGSPPQHTTPALLLRHVTLPNMAGTRFLELPNLDAMCSHIMVEFILPFSVFPTLAAKRRAMAADLFVAAFERRLQALQHTTSPPPFEAALVDRDMILRELCRFTVTLQVADGAAEVATALKVALMALEEVKVRGFANHEVAAAKAARENDLSCALADGTDRDSFVLAELCSRHFLHDGQTLLMSSQDETRAERMLVAAITAPELAGVARQLRLGYGCRVLWQHSAENGYQLLGTDALKDMVLEVKMLTSSADWVPSAVVAPSPHMPGGELPGKLNITARRGDVLMKRDTGIEGVTEWYLSNGMTVVTCAGAANSDDVRVRCVAPGGISELSGSAVKAAALSCFAMELAGLGDLSADELEEALQGHAISFRLSINAQTRCVDGHGGSADLDVLLALLHMSFQTQSLKQEELDTAVDTMRTLVHAQRLAPEFSFARTVGVLSEGPKVLSRNPSFMQLNVAPPLETVNRIHRAAFSDPSEFVVIVAGAIPAAARIRQLLSKFVASIVPPAAAAADATASGWWQLASALRTAAPARSGHHRVSAAARGGLASGGSGAGRDAYDARPPEAARHAVTPSPSVFPQGAVRKTVRRGMASRSSVRVTFPARLRASDATAPLFLAHRTACAVLQAALVREMAEHDLGAVGITVELCLDVLDLGAARSVVHFNVAPKRADAAITATLRAIDRLQHDGCSQAEVERVVGTFQDASWVSSALTPPSSPGTPFSPSSRPGERPMTPSSMPGTPASAAVSGDADSVSSAGHVASTVANVTAAALWSRCEHPVEATHTDFRAALRMFMGRSGGVSSKACATVTKVTVKRASQDLFPVRHYAAVTLAPDVQGSMRNLIM